MVATKLAAGWQYHRRGFVDMKLVGRMSIGSVPGALLGVACLALLRLYRGGSVNHILRIMIGVLLVTTPAIALLKNCLEGTGRKSLRERLPAYITAQNGAVVVGLVGGCLVGMTSIGSGSADHNPRRHRHCAFRDLGNGSGCGSLGDRNR